MPTYMYVYAHACMYVYIPDLGCQLNIHTYTQTYKQTNIHIYMHTYIAEHTHTYTTTYIHIYIHKQLAAATRSRMLAEIDFELKEKVLCTE
jgi:hypothetical protein